MRASTGRKERSFSADMRKASVPVVKYSEAFARPFAHPQRSTRALGKAYRMTAPTTGTTATLGIDHYAFVLLRQWKIVAAAAVAGALIAGATLLLVPRTYTATTTVLANVITVNPFSQGQSASQLFDYATEASIARSQSVVDLAAPSIPGGREPAEIRDNLEVSTSSDSTVVVIAYTAGSESQARTGADALATSYLDYRSAKAEERIDAAVTNLDDSLADLNDELAGANAALATNAPETQVYIEASSVKDSVTLEINRSRRNAPNSSISTRLEGRC